MADLFVAGIATIGINHGITTIYRSVIACGLFMMLLAPVFGKLIRFCPPLVTGAIILIIGVSADAGRRRLVRRRYGSRCGLRVAFGRRYGLLHAGRHHRDRTVRP